MLDYIGRTYLRYLSQSATLIRILFKKKAQEAIKELYKEYQMSILSELK